MTIEFYKTLQEDVGEWSDEQFGEQPSTFPLIGQGEEMGELAYATDNGTRDEIKDAIGDIIVYLADVCHRRELQLGEWVDYIPSDMWYTDNLYKGLLHGQERLNHSVLKKAQGIRLNEETTGFKAEMHGVAITMHYLSRIADAHRLTLQECVEFAWGEVSERAWDAEVDPDA